MRIISAHKRSEVQFFSRLISNTFVAGLFLCGLIAVLIAVMLFWEQCHTYSGQLMVGAVIALILAYPALLQKPPKFLSCGQLFDNRPLWLQARGVDKVQDSFGFRARRSAVSSRQSVLVQSEM